MGFYLKSQCLSVAVHSRLMRVCWLAIFIAMKTLLSIGFPFLLHQQEELPCKSPFSVFWGQSQDCNVNLSRCLSYLPSVNWNKFSLENFIITLEVTGSMRVLQNQSWWASCGHWVRSGQSGFHEQRSVLKTQRKRAFCMRQHRHSPQVTSKTIFYLHWFLLLYRFYENGVPCFNRFVTHQKTFLTAFRVKSDLQSHKLKTFLVIWRKWFLCDFNPPFHFHSGKTAGDKLLS